MSKLELINVVVLITRAPSLPHPSSHISSLKKDQGCPEIVKMIDQKKSCSRCWSLEAVS